MASLADKLRRRWTDTGSGPDVQKKLDAIEGTMKAREARRPPYISCSNNLYASEVFAQDSFIQCGRQASAWSCR